MLAREPISAKLLADLLTAAGSDRVVSVDLHAGQIQGYFDFPFDHLTALPVLSGYLQNELGLHGDDLVIVSPDAAGIKTAERLREYLTPTSRSSTSAGRARRRTRSRRWRSSVRSTDGRASSWTT